MIFKMNGIKWEIYEGNQLEYKKERIKYDKETGCKETDTENGIFNGSTSYPDCKIFLDETLPADRKRKVLLHELTHCFICEYMSHEDKQYNEEDVCDVVSNSFDIIREIVDSYNFEK